MAASPIISIPASVSISRRRPLALTQRRLAANRRNAMRSTGPRTAEGKAKVARNPIKHGFFTEPAKWTLREQRDFVETFDGLREDFKPESVAEESWLALIAESYVRMAAMLRYENIAALKYHEQCDRELNDRIAAANAAEAARLEAQRENLRRAGLWTPTIPGPREAKAIIRYSGSLDRTIRRAAAELEGLRALRPGASRPHAKVQKQTHYSAAPNSGPEAPRRACAQRFDHSAAPNSGPEARRRACAQRFDHSAAPNGGPGAPRRASSGMAPRGETQKQTHFEAKLRSGPEAAEGPQAAHSGELKNAKANPLSSMFTGNRHERRRAKALARQGKET